MKMLLKYAIVVCLPVFCFFIATLKYIKERRANLPYFGPMHAPVENAGNRFLSLQTARDFCQQYQLEPYATRGRQRKVYDMFLINTELDMLELRLHELDSEVDYFVILESGKIILNS